MFPSFTTKIRVIKYEYCLSKSEIGYFLKRKYIIFAIMNANIIRIRFARKKSVVFKKKLCPCPTSFKNPGPVKSNLLSNI